MAKVIEAINPHAAWATMSVKMLINIFVYGLLTGIGTFALYMALEQFVFEPILCSESAALARCETKEEFASGVAIILGSMLGLALLVRERVYRPILAVIGVAISLWSIFSLVGALPIVMAVIVTIILYGLAYVLFSWLVQPTSLVISVAGVIVVTVLARLVAG